MESLPLMALPFKCGIKALDPERRGIDRMRGTLKTEEEL